jgi:hypothetical protein
VNTCSESVTSQNIQVDVPCEGLTVSVNVYRKRIYVSISGSKKAWDKSFYVNKRENGRGKKERG